MWYYFSRLFHGAEFHIPWNILWIHVEKKKKRSDING